MANTLTISWTAASPAPANGYRVKYWPTADPSNITTVTPNVVGTSVTLTGLTESSYSGTVESVCGTNIFSNTVSWTAALPPDPGSNCDCYTVSVPGGGSINVGYFTCPDNIQVTDPFVNGNIVTVYPGSIPTIELGTGSLIGPNTCVN